jgi:anti-anti-sigma factor
MVNQVEQSLGCTHTEPFQTRYSRSGAVPLREPSPSEILSLDVRPDGGRVVVAVRGELDMATVGSVECALRRVREAGSRDVVLDLQALTFVDCAGLNVLLAADRDARAEGWNLAILDGSPALERLLEITDLRDHFAAANQP